MSLYGALDASKHFDEFDDPIDSQEGVLSSATRKARALANLGVTATAAEIATLTGVTAGTVTASKALVVDANKDLASLRNLTLTGLMAGATMTLSSTAVITGTLTQGSDTTDRVAIKGIYMSPANVVVAVPTIANDAAENADSVAVDVSGAFSMQPAVGDAVIALPAEAMPTDCLIAGAYVTATDEITVTFMSKEGGGGVTGANKNFKFLVIDLT